MRAARMFLGVPYLWGGTTPNGFDCSGLVQRVYGFFGVDLPRDADQQGRSGREVARARPGDLCFFGRRRITHVGICLGDGAYLHAYGHVRENSLRPADPAYLEEVSRLYRFTRRVLP